MSEKPKKTFKMPDTWVIVFCMVVIVSILSWIVPPGQYDYEQADTFQILYRTVRPYSVLQ